MRKQWEAAFERVRLDASVFEAKYGSATLEQVKQARDKIHEKWQGMKNNALDARYAAGLYAEEPTRMMKAPGATEESLGFLVEQKGDGQLVRLHSIDDPTKARVVWLPYEEYGEIYDVQDEWAWLSSKVWQSEEFGKSEWKK